MHEEVNTLESSVQSYLQLATSLFSTFKEMKHDYFEHLIQQVADEGIEINEKIIEGIKESNDKHYTRNEANKDKQFYAEQLLKVQATILSLSKDDPKNEALKSYYDIEPSVSMEISQYKAA